MAPGTAMPMAAKPLEMMQVLGRSALYMRDIHILCAPTSEIAMSSGASTSRRSHTIFCGLMGKAVSLEYSARSA